jgi:hypothetical protein
MVLLIPPNLDVHLIMTEGGNLETGRFIKPTNPQLFLHYNSNHPRQVFKAIVYGQGITVKTICTKEDFVVKHFDDLRRKNYRTRVPNRAG